MATKSSPDEPEPEATVPISSTNSVAPTKGDGPKEYHAHFDCFSGAAGDMLLASCLDASENPDDLLTYVEQCLRKGMPELADEFEIRTKRVWKGGMGSIAGLHINVLSKYNHKAAPVPKRSKHGQREDSGIRHRSHHHNHGHHHGHSSHHDHQHHHNDSRADNNEVSDRQIPDIDRSQQSYNHSHDHGHSHNHTTSKNEPPLRNLPEIRRLLHDADEIFLDPWVKSTAIAAFTELAKAEAQTHGADTVDAVHFHEVGAVDSIVDTVGTLVALHCLRVKTFSCSRLPLGEGTVWTDHGILPVPAPATLRLLVGMPTCPGPQGVITGELVTPTGAALLRTLCLDSCGRPPHFTIRKIGIGAGTKEFEKHPNILRLLIGDDVVTKS